MSICLATGLPHVTEDCDRCAAFEARLAYARAHPSVVAANEATARAWEAFQAGKHRPDKEARPLEDAWRAAIEAERLTFSAACDEYTTTHQGAPPRA